MTADGSIATLTEDWIITQLRAMQYQGQSGPVNVFETTDVEPWEGSTAGAVQEFSQQLMAANRPRVARVLYVADRVEELTEDQIRCFATYWALIGIRDYTGKGVPRRGLVRGTDAYVGTNLLRDLLKAKFNQKKPAVTDTVTYVQMSRYAGCEIKYMEDNVCLVKAVIEAEEVPAAA